MTPVITAGVRFLLLPGAVAGSHFGGRRVAAGGADALPGEGGRVRRHGPAQPRGPQGRFKLCALDASDLAENRSAH